MSNMSASAGDDVPKDEQPPDANGTEEVATAAAAAPPGTSAATAANEAQGNNDLVFREGFPALWVSGTRTPLVDGDEPIPRHSFWSCENMIEFSPKHFDDILSDCETVFTSRDRDDGQAYSTGQTFFCPATMKPRCALEALVLTIFEKHVQHVDKGMYNLEQSGAEWWTLVLDGDDEPKAKNDDSNNVDDPEEEEDEVGIHFDADYELEDQAANLLLHPRIATVTYLSDFGAPTLVVDLKSPPMDDVKKTALEKEIPTAWLSHPVLGKHTAFDGRLLHGAPALFFPSMQKNKYIRANAENGDGEPASKRRKTTPQKRVTLLVNIWLNHWVLDAALLDDDVVSKLKTPWQNPPADSNLKKTNDDNCSSLEPPFSWNEKVDLSQPTVAEKVRLEASKVDPAGEDDIALCNHNVTVKYNPTMEECHRAASLGRSVEIELCQGAMSLQVGGELSDESDGDEEK